MYDYGTLILNLTMVFATVWIIRKFLGTICEKKKFNIQAAAAWTLFGLFQLYVEYNKGNASIVITFVSIALVIIVALNTYRNIGKIQFFYILLLYVIWALIEMMVFYFLELKPLGEEEFSILGSIISKIITMIFVYVWAQNKERRNNIIISMPYYILLLFVPIGSIYIAVYVFFLSDTGEYHISSVIIFCILTIMNIVIFEICLKLSENFNLEKERTVYAQQLALISQNTQEQNRIMKEFHEEKHNLINELIAIEDNIKNEDKDRVILSLNGIISNFNAEHILESGNATIDSLINIKYATAREKGIEFVLKVFIPENIAIDPCALGIVIGNALDNAIEAAEKCTRHEKKIFISMGVRKEAFVVVIKNPYEHELKTDKDGDLISTKAENKRHGYGVNSIKKAVEKNHGDVSVEYDGDMFVMTAIIHFGEILQQMA